MRTTWDLTVQVTSQDIAKACLTDEHPMVPALRRALRRNKIAGPHMVIIREGRIGCRLMSVTPPVWFVRAFTWTVPPDTAEDFTRKYARGQKVYPLTFRLKFYSEDTGGDPGGRTAREYRRWRTAWETRRSK